MSGLSAVIRRRCICDQIMKGFIGRFTLPSLAGFFVFVASEYGVSVAEASIVLDGRFKAAIPSFRYCSSILAECSSTASVVPKEKPKVGECGEDGVKGPAPKDKYGEARSGSAAVSTDEQGERLVEHVRRMSDEESSAKLCKSKTLNWVLRAPGLS